MDAGLKFDHELLSVEGDNDVHCMFELHVPTPADADERVPLRIALVLDRSGSMTGDKLDVAKQCAQFVAHRLQPTDLLSVVAFDGEVDLVAPLGAPSAATEAAVDALQPGGSTNLSGGWLKGLEELGRAGGDCCMSLTVNATPFVKSFQVGDGQIHELAWVLPPDLLRRRDNEIDVAVDRASTSEMLIVSASVADTPASTRQTLDLSVRNPRMLPTFWLPAFSGARPLGQFLDPLVAPYLDFFPSDLIWLFALVAYDWLALRRIHPATYLPFVLLFAYFMFVTPIISENEMFQSWLVAYWQGLLA